MRISVEVFGDTQLDRELLRWAHAADDMSPVFAQVARDFRATERRQFDSEGANSGGWAPLAPATVARRGSAHPILRVTGDLRRSLTTLGAKGNVTRISAHELVVGTRISYARHHQTGTRTMPRRRPVELTDADRRRFVKAVQRWLATGRIDVAA